MKKFIPYIACGLLLISGWACTRTDDLDVVGVEQGKIVIRTALDPQVETRVVADESAERKITRIDVVVVDPANNTIVHREVHTNTDGLNDSSAVNGNGTLTLKTERNTFVEDKAYNIYLIANASEAIAAKIEDDSATATLDDLKRLVQEDYISTTANGATTFSTLLHLSGTTTPQATAPQTFLMDAVVTASKESEVRDIVLYNGVQTENTNVYAEFKRAAAKVIINIKQGSSVEFKRTLNLTADDNNGVATTGDAQYEFYNLPTETKVLAEGYDLGRDNNTLIETELITIPNTAEGGSYPTFVWKDDVGSVAADGTGDVKVQIVGYADAHEWANVSTLNYEPSLLLNLPIMWDANKDADKDDGKETGRGGNWYKVPLSQNKVFERNTCYIVNITINAVGAESKSEAIELDDIDYDTRPWDVTTIKIGGDSERPKYLKLNTDLVTMYNTNIDTEQLVFSSSSPITSIVLKDVYRHDLSTGSIVAGAGTDMAAYYIDKYSTPIALDQLTQNTISATAKWGALNGNITILSPIMGTTPEERRIALEALGDEPVLPEEPDVTGKPELSNYVPESESRPTNPRNGAQYTVYQYNASTNTIQSMTYTYSSGFLGFGSGWSSGSWTNMENPQAYEDDLAEWLEDHPEYRAYQEALEKYQAYNAAESAITASANAGETHHNTIRYLEFEVRNEDGLTATFRVEQYPVIYITHVMGWYSYRQDFNGTTWEKTGSPSSITGCDWNGDKHQQGSNSSDFGSKVAVKDGNSYEIYYYVPVRQTTGDPIGTLNNPRMYFVRVTATSSKYTIGKPVLDDDGYTDSSADNAELVSPSFMIASQLGATQSCSNSQSASLHCNQYVEVAQDGTIYDDWRLPTAAEINIIIDLQYNSQAMDPVLTGATYWSASGVQNTGTGDGNNRIRCIRDAYNDPKEN